MRILIFGEAFLAPAYLPRVRYFCSYFIDKGWDIDLIFESSDNHNYVPDHVSGLPIEYYINKQGVTSKIEWLIKFILNMFYDYKGRFFFRKSTSFIEDKQYDLVFCSSSFTFPLTTAAKVAKNKNIPLFVDLRDIAEQSPNDNHYIANKRPIFIGDLITNIYKKININRRNKILKIANGITTVSPWHVHTLSKYNPNTHLIYNGFDEAKFRPREIITERFTISYFGRVYNEYMRNPQLLFHALHNLNEKGLITSENTTVSWFLDENSKNVIQKMAKEYGMENFIEYHNFVKPENLQTEMNKSSILLVLCNIATKKKYFGIMTTKFFEAIGANRPILCIPNNNDNLSELMIQTNCGLVSSETSEIEAFLLNKFIEWKETGHTNGTLKESVRMNFSRKKGAEILEKLFLEAIK